MKPIFLTVELGDRRRRVQSAVSERWKSRSGELSLRPLKDFCKLWASLSLGSWGVLTLPQFFRLLAFEGQA